MRPLFTICLLASLAMPAFANTVLLGTSNPFTGAEPIAESTQAIAQPFTLTTSVSISTIDLTINKELPTDPLIVQLTDAIGPGTTTSNVVFQTSLSPGSISVSPGNVAIAAPITLGPGTYYIVLSTTDGFGYDWELAQSVLPSSVGTVGHDLYCCFPNPVGSFAPAETFKDITGLNEPAQFLFDLQSGSTTSAPEPASMLLVATGTAALSVRKRRSLR